MTESLFPTDTAESQYDPERPNAGQYTQPAPVTDTPSKPKPELKMPSASSQEAIDKAAARRIAMTEPAQEQPRTRASNTLVDAVSITSLADAIGNQEVADILDVHVNTVQKYIREKSAPAAAEMLCRYVYEERFVLPQMPKTITYLVQCKSNNAATIEQVLTALGASCTTLEV